MRFEPNGNARPYYMKGTITEDSSVGWKYVEKLIGMSCPDYDVAEI